MYGHTDILAYAGPVRQGNGWSLPTCPPRRRGPGPEDGGVRQCQSCGMPLQTAEACDCRGTEVDGSRSEEWCSLCYRGGAFIDPDCPLEQMQAIVEAALRERGSNRAFRWMARKQIPTLARWAGQ